MYSFNGRLGKLKHHKEIVLKVYTVINTTHLVSNKGTVFGKSMVIIMHHDFI